MSLKVFPAQQGGWQATPSAFLAYNSANDLNVTGAGTTFTVDFDTEIFDLAGDFAADTFTAPTTGQYLLTATVQIQGLTAAADNLTLQLVTSNRTYSVSTQDTNDMPNGTWSISAVADMDALDTATVTILVNGEATNVCDVQGGATLETFFSGYRVG